MGFGIYIETLPKSDFVVFVCVVEFERLGLLLLIVNGSKKF
jgi:hypothetical protein